MSELSYLPKTGLGFGLDQLTVKRQPSYTHKLDISQGRVRGFTDEKDALLQAIYLCLSTERYEYLIYSRNYGIESQDLIGEPMDFVMSEIKRRITEALEQDDRIEGVEDWAFERGKRSLTVSFTVRTIYGSVKTAKEVRV